MISSRKSYGFAFFLSKCIKIVAKRICERKGKDRYLMRFNFFLMKTRVSPLLLHDHASSLLELGLRVELGLGGHLFI
jgi:hypothetical protein